MNEEKEESPALHLIRHVAEHEGFQQGRSNDRRNHAIDGAVTFAIEYGLRFLLDDFLKLATHGTVSYSNTSLIRFSGSPEMWYSLACGRERGRDNKSAALSMEKWLERKPFLVRESPDVDTPTRVYVGRFFEWYTKRVTVTSFKDTTGSFIACTYKPKSENACERKIDKRYTITHECIRKYHESLKSGAVV